MAYKFQRGDSILSGNVEVQNTGGEISVSTQAGIKNVELLDTGIISGSGELNVNNIKIYNGLGAGAVITNTGAFAGTGFSGSAASSFLNATVQAPGALTVLGELKMADNTSGHLLVADGNDFASVATSGEVTIASGGAMTIANSAVVTDRIADLNVTTGKLANDAVTNAKLADDAVQKENLAADVAGTGLEQHSDDSIRIAASAAGDGLTGGGGSALAVAVSGALAITSDKVAISGSIAGPGLRSTGPIGAIKTLELNIDNLDALGGTGIVNNDKLLFSDNSVEKTITFENFTNATFGKIGGDATVAAGGALTIGAGTIDGGAGGGMLSTGLVHDQTAMTGAINSLDKFLFSDHSEAANRMRSLSVEILGKELMGASVVKDATTGSADQLLFLDATDNDLTKKCSIVQFLDTIAGPGITANSDGTISADGAGTPSVVGDGAVTLTEGYNFYTGSANKVVSLPASPSVGDVYYVKAGDLGDGNSIRITGSNDQHLIDGEQQVFLESKFGSVGFVYLVAGNFGIV